MTRDWTARRWDGSGWAHRLAVVATGAVAALGFAPYHFWGLTLLSLALLFVRLVGVSTWERPGRAGFGTGLLFGLGWFSASCFWIASAFIERGPEFIPMIPPLVGGLAVLLSLFWGVAGGLTARLSERGAGPALITFVAAFGLAELARGHVLSGFPWNLAAYAVEPGSPLSQTAHWTGVYGLTSILYLAAAGIGLAWVSRKLAPALASVLYLAGLWGLGAVRLASASTDVEPGVVLRLVAVPFRQSEKLNRDTAARITDAHVAQSVAPGLDRVTHLVWPEGAVNGLATEDEGFLRFVGLNLAAADPDTPPVWLMNSLRRDFRNDANGVSRPVYFNSSVAVTFDEAGNPAIATSNDKRKLVPFGEFIPGGELVERFGAQLVSTALASITPAPEKRVSNFPGLPPISPQICYEVIFPGLTPHGDPAPQAILNQSNDAWFGATVGPAQHAAIARYRAIEEGLPLIRSAANGISGVFDPYGRAERVLDGKTATFMDELLPKALGPSIPLRIINAGLSLINLILLLVAGSWATSARRATRGVGYKEGKLRSGSP
jgi:apolipoprotein N-acyltransferase